MIDAKNAIAVFLLSQGADLQQTSHFADVVTRTVGIQGVQRMNAITDTKERMSSLQQCAQKFHIRWPEFPKSETSNMKSVNKANAKKTWKQQQDIKADAFRLISEHFVNEDGTPCAVRSDIVPNSSGVALLDHDVAQQWLQDFKVISQDELALLTLGHSCPAVDKSKCNPVQVVQLVPPGLRSFCSVACIT